MVIARNVAATVLAIEAVGHVVDLGFDCVDVDRGSFDGQHIGAAFFVAVAADSSTTTGLVVGVVDLVLRLLIKNVGIGDFLGLLGWRCADLGDQLRVSCCVAARLRRGISEYVYLFFGKFAGRDLLREVGVLDQRGAALGLSLYGSLGRSPARRRIEKVLSLSHGNARIELGGNGPGLDRVENRAALSDHRETVGNRQSEQHIPNHAHRIGKRTVKAATLVAPPRCLAFRTGVRHMNHTTDGV